MNEISADPTAFAEKGFVILQVLPEELGISDFDPFGILKHTETYENI